MSTVVNSPVLPPPTLHEWVVWVDRVGGQWAAPEEIARIARDDDDQAQRPHDLNLSKDISC